MKFVTYFLSSGDSSQFSEKFLLLRYFSEGVSKLGDTVIQHLDSDYVPADVALIQGWSVDHQNTNINNTVRRMVIENQLLSQKYVISADSNLFLYAVGKANEPGHYLRYSFNGIFPNTGIYCDHQVDPDRWKKISKNLGIDVRDYRSTGNHILMLLQRDGGWSMGKYLVRDWIVDTVKKIRKYSDRPIIIRPHPGDKGNEKYYHTNFAREFLPEYKKISFSKNTDLRQDLVNSWAAVNHNSSAAVGAAIEGFPIFVTDPEKSQCVDIANTDFSQIETPVLPDRQAWLERISQFHWNFSELRSGECWSHMRQFTDLNHTDAKSPEI
jgi:hypothetical protein